MIQITKICSSDPQKLVKQITVEYYHPPLIGLKRINKLIVVPFAPSFSKQSFKKKQKHRAALSFFQKEVTTNALGQVTKVTRGCFVECKASQSATLNTYCCSGNWCNAAEKITAYSFSLVSSIIVTCLMMH